MQCKICKKGLVLKKLEHTKNGKVTIILEPVSCDCCGGFFENCENCEAGRRVVEWIDDVPPHPGSQRFRTLEFPF
jgi:hypothetical protein